jgi:hypothetical protein
MRDSVWMTDLGPSRRRCPLDAAERHSFPLSRVAGPWSASVWNLETK